MNIKAEDSIKIKGQLTVIIRDAKTGKIKSIDRIKNMYVTRGKYAIAQRMAGQDAGEITYCALGTNATAPALADTKLGAEIQRKLISVRSYLNNVATFQTFFTINEGNGSLKEAALFGTGVGQVASGTIDSGQIFCRTNIDRTKTTGDTLTLEWTITIN
jgi:hypothetical protein